MRCNLQSAIQPESMTMGVFIILRRAGDAIIYINSCCKKCLFNHSIGTIRIHETQIKSREHRGGITEYQINFIKFDYKI